ncbi:MAG: hypothetical protein V1908_04060, partial [Candidatus Peregrinibacteria bacterium]
MDKSFFLRNFRRLTDKDDGYYLFQGWLFSISSEETCKALDLGFNQDIYKRKLFLYKINNDLKKGEKSEYLTLFDQLLAVAPSLDSYYKKQACSVILNEISLHASEKQREKLIQYLFQTGYVYDRVRGYGILRRMWKDSYTVILEE